MVKRFVIALVLVVLICGGLVGFNLFRTKMINNFFAHMPQQAVAVSTAKVEPTNWQPQIDACKGAVDLTAHYGIRTIAEHDTCGGSSFPTTPGTIVRITGVDAGFYRVVGVVAYLDGHTSTRYDLPRGYDLLFQTCVNGYSDMSFTALTRIGG